jgi:hypothetical protein
MLGNRLLSYLHPQRKRSSFPNMRGRGNHMMNDGPTVNESRHGGIKERKVPGRNHQTEK